MNADNGIKVKSFKGTRGGNEHFFIIKATPSLSLEEQIEEVQERYAASLESLNLAPETAIFRRIFLSDAINQAPLVRASSLAAETKKNPVAVSIIQQTPLPGSKIALLAHHIESPHPIKKKRLLGKHVLIEKNNLRHLWSTGLCAGAHAASSPETVQTREVFNDLIEALSRQKCNLGDHCVRTWLFMKDVDVFYRGMVSARREYFEKFGMNENTHYIASTGIEGACEHQFDLVSMDAYTLPDLRPEQMSYLNDFDYLCPTKDYNVTFERGTKIAYADRAHHFISGTASIDMKGDVVFIGDVMKQVERTLTNIDRLLLSGGAKLDDMMYFIVYLRDPADYENIDACLAQRFPATPYVIVQGPVCRPEWLIEIEGVGIAPNDTPHLPEF